VWSRSCRWVFRGVSLNIGSRAGSPEREIRSWREKDRENARRLNRKRCRRRGKIKEGEYTYQWRGRQLRLRYLQGIS